MQTGEDSKDTGLMAWVRADNTRDTDCRSAATAFRPGLHCHLVELLTIAPMGLRRVDAESQAPRSPGPAGRASTPTKPVSSYHFTSLVKVTLFFTDDKGI